MSERPSTGGHAEAVARADATALLTIDLGALRANYRKLRDAARRAECAAVVKADAYGLGASEVVQALSAEGCRTFFVATADEARALRQAGRDDLIYVLDGLLPGAAAGLAEASLRPCLGSLAEVEEWADHCARIGARLPAALHIDTGMNRLGLPEAEVDALAGRVSLFDAFDLALVMSHLACADEPAHPKSAAQREAFDRLRAKLPPAPASLANSAGVLLGTPFHYDLLRPGIALYGGNPLVAAPNPMSAVVRLDGRIAQLRRAQPGETVGYGATWTLTRPTTIATVVVGYADGYMRLLGSREEVPGATAYVGDHPAPILGRVSMDLITLDVTDVPERVLARGRFVELLGPHVSVDDLAARAHTIGYEILTSLGRRYQRVYIGS